MREFQILHNRESLKLALKGTTYIQITCRNKVRCGSGNGSKVWKILPCGCSLKINAKVEPTRRRVWFNRYFLEIPKSLFLLVFPLQKPNQGGASGIPNERALKNQVPSAWRPLNLAGLGKAQKVTAAYRYPEPREHRNPDPTGWVFLQASVRPIIQSLGKHTLVERCLLLSFKHKNTIIILTVTRLKTVLRKWNLPS